jgi:O-antigen/teichoic acid export membrane protein
MTSGQPGASSPRSVFKDILQGSSLYSIAMIAPRAVSVILLPIITRYLSRADYGILDIMEQVGVVLALLLGAGFSSALGYFYFAAESTTEGRRRVVGTAVAGATALGILAGLIGLLLAGPLSTAVFRMASVRPYLLFGALALSLGFPLETLFTWLRVENRPGVYLAGSLLRLVLTVATVVLFVALLGLRIWGMLISSTVTIGLTALILAIYCFRTVRPRIDPQLFVRMARFSAPIGLSGIAAFIMNFGDRLILPRFVTFDQLGIYALAYKIGLLVGVLYASFHGYWSAQVFSILRHRDWEVIFARTLTYVIAGLSFCGLAIAVCARPVLRILVAKDFQAAAVLVPIIVAAYCVKAVGDFLRCLFIAQGRPGYDAISNWMGAAVCLAAYATLIPRFGIWGAAVATLIAFAVMGVISVIWTYRMKPWRIEPVRLLKVGMALAISVSPFGFLPATSLAAQLGTAALSIVLFPTVILLSRFLTAGEIEVATAALRSFTGRS